MIVWLDEAAGPVKFTGRELNLAHWTQATSPSSSQLWKPEYATPACACAGWVISVVTPWFTSGPPAAKLGATTWSMGVPAGMPGRSPPTIRLVLTWVKVAVALLYLNVIGKRYLAPTLHSGVGWPASASWAPYAVELPFISSVANWVPAAMPSWPKVTPGSAACCDRSCAWTRSTVECAITG